MVMASTTPTTDEQERLASILEAIRDHPNTVPASETNDTMYDIITQ